MEIPSNTSRMSGRWWWRSCVDSVKGAIGIHALLASL